VKVKTTPNYDSHMTYGSRMTHDSHMTHFPLCWCNLQQWIQLSSKVFTQEQNSYQVKKSQ